VTGNASVANKLNAPFPLTDPLFVLHFLPQQHKRLAGLQATRSGLFARYIRQQNLSLVRFSAS